MALTTLLAAVSLLAGRVPGCARESLGVQGVLGYSGNPLLVLLNPPVVRSSVMPAMPSCVSLNPRLEYDAVYLAIALAEWRLLGLLVNYPEGMICYRGPHKFSRYELAVAVHAAWANGVGVCKSKLESPEKQEKYKQQFDDISWAISMLEPQLTKLGADTQAMIDRMSEVLAI